MPSIGELIEDIEKRMIDLGYEDLEEFASPDHDVKSLMALKRRLMDEKKERQSNKKKLVENTKPFRNLLVKISRVFKKDFYICNGTFCIPGKLSGKEAKGTFVVIDSIYKDNISAILKPDTDKEFTVYYIKDVSEFKVIVDEFIEDENNIFTVALERGCAYLVDDIEATNKGMSIVDILDDIDKDSDKFKTISIDLNDHDIIDIKKRISIKYSEDYPAMEINLSMFPYCNVNEDGILNVDYMSGIYETSDNSNIYYVRFKIFTDELTIYLKKYYI